MGNVVAFNKPTSHMQCEDKYFVDAIDHFHRNFEPSCLLRAPSDWKPILYYGGFVDDLYRCAKLIDDGWVWTDKEIRDVNAEIIKLVDESVYNRYHTTEYPFPHFYIRESCGDNSEIITVFHIKEKTYRKYMLPDIKLLLETFEITPEKPTGSYRKEASILGMGREKFLNKFSTYFKDITNDENHMSELLNTIIQTYDFSKHSITLLPFAE